MERIMRSPVTPAMRKLLAVWGRKGGQKTARNPHDLSNAGKASWKARVRRAGKLPRDF